MQPRIESPDYSSPFSRITGRRRGFVCYYPGERSERARDFIS
jgi:hypothetical protein